MVNIKQVKGGGTFDMDACKSEVPLTGIGIKTLLETRGGKWIIQQLADRTLLYEYIPIGPEEAAQECLAEGVDDDRIPDSLQGWYEIAMNEENEDNDDSD